jgi:hypothetical protein
MTNLWTPLAEHTISGTTANVTFNSIPQGYRDLALVAEFNVGANGVLELAYNNSYSNLNRVRIMNIGSGDYYTDTNAGEAGSGDNRSHAIYHIFDYASTTLHKNAIMRTGGDNYKTMLTAQRWGSSDAVTSLKISFNQNFVSGTFYLYGSSLG